MRAQNIWRYLFASAICAVPGHIDFPAHNAEQAFVIWIKNTRSRVSGRRRIRDESGNLLRIVNNSTCGETMWDRVTCSLSEALGTFVAPALASLGAVAGLLASAQTPVCSTHRASSRPPRSSSRYPPWLSSRYLSPSRTIWPVGRGARIISFADLVVLP